MSRLPPATARTLEALDAAPNKRIAINDFRKATGVKTRAYYPFLNRLLDAPYIVGVGDLSRDHWYSITFKGMKALEAHRAAILKAKAS